MSFERGDLVYVKLKGPYTGKPRPVVIVQTTQTLPYRDSVTACPLTGELIDAPLFRVRNQAAPANGLEKTSDIMVDKIVTIPRSALDAAKIERLSAAHLDRLDAALAYWLGL